MAPSGHHHSSLQLAHSLVVGSCSRKSSNENFLSDESDFVTTEIFVADIPQKFLKEELFLMLRLPNPLFMPELTGQSGLLYFLILFIGPMDGCPKERHEMGRVMATLMADKNFHRLTLLASKKEDLTEGIDHFLGCSTLIPPGKIDDRSLFSPENLPTPSETMSTKRKSNFSSKISEISELKSELLNHDVTETSVNCSKEKRKIGVSTIERMAESPFDKTGRSFGGLVRDFKNRLPFYADDFSSAFNFQCLTSILFIFFANFAVAVAMGEALSEKTNGLLGVTEVLVSHAISGTIWALFSGQPLCIVAAVGPFLVFESSLCQFCDSINLDYLSVRFWTGIWTFGFMLLMAMIEAPTVMRYLTRFTEDIYTAFIAAIFVWEGGKFVYDEFRSHPLSYLDTYCEKSSFNCSSSTNATSANFNETAFRARKWQNNVRLADQPDTAFLSLILFVMTFLLAFGLKRLRTSIYCGRTLSPLRDHDLKHVNIKPSFDLTSPEKRGWFVRPLGTRQQPLPLYMLFASMIPAFLASVVIFAQTEIVEILLSKEERRLRKPGGFHLDLVVNGVVVLIASVLGVQWLTPAAVQSLSHAASLTVMKRAAPGETPEIHYVIEQRVTLLIIALLHDFHTYDDERFKHCPCPIGRADFFQQFF
uniref:Anion exchange protein n=1 Tax=Romanomermis culicivorax TaxID=13658 RepID=A0A915KTP9_ROMCU